MKNKILLTTLIVALGLILPLVLVCAVEIDEPGDAGPQLPTISSDGVSNAPPSSQEGNIAKLVQYIYTFALLAAGLAVIGGLIYGGVLYLFAGGSSTQVAKAKDRVRGALYGLGLILISYLILYTINPALVNLVNPTADPLKLRSSPIWSLSLSYGQQLANVPKDRPCLSDFDCTYDLACCPAQTTDKKEVTGCNQNLAGEALPENKNDLNGLPSAEVTNLKWFSCGLGETYWWLGESCPATTTAAPNCSAGATTGCCDPQTKPSADKNPICCQQPLMVTAKDEAECKTTYGSQAKYNNCSCLTRVATCQKIKPPAKDTISTYSWTTLWASPTERLKLSAYGSKCYADETRIGIVLGWRDYSNSSCRDQRLVCNTQSKICIEPGEVGGQCKKHILKSDVDCCGVKQKNDETPNCTKYVSRGISLYCYQPTDTDLGQCMLSDKNAAEIEEGGTDGTEGDTSGPEPDRATCTWVDGKAKPTTPPNAPTQQAPLTGTCEEVTTFQHNLNPLYGILPAQGQTGDGGCTSLRSDVSAKCCCKAQAVTAVTGTCKGIYCSTATAYVCSQGAAYCYETNVNSYDEEIAAAADKNPITNCPLVDTIKLIKAIMAQESGGKIDIGSSDRQSAGLMQLKPTTADLYKVACGVPATTDINFAWLKNEANAEAQICMAVEFLKTLSTPSSCGCSVRNLAAGFNGGSVACQESANCGHTAGTGRCLMCPDETITRKWECPWDDNQHQDCNYKDSDPSPNGSFGYTIKYVPKVNYCYNQF